MLNSIEMQAYINLQGETFGFIDDSEKINLDKFKEDIQIYKKQLSKEKNTDIVLSKDNYDEYLRYIQEKEIKKERKIYYKNKKKVRLRRYNSTQKRRKRKLKNNPNFFHIYKKYNQYGDFFYSQFSTSSGRNSKSNFLLKISNKKIRNLPLKFTPQDGGSYRKVFDYWWSLY